MLTRFALNNRAIVLATVIAALLLGPLSFVSHPSREDPKIVIRTASVTAAFPGMSPDRVENLITRKLEEKIREIPEVDKIESTSRTGQSLVQATVHARYTDMKPIWADLRNKIDDVRTELPEGTQGPFVNDDKGNVAMATIALTAEGFELWEMREAAKELRRLIYSRVDGVRKVELYGVEEQRVFVEFDNIRVAQLGIEAGQIINLIQNQNIILPGGRIEADGTTWTIEPTGNFNAVSDLDALSFSIPDRPGTSIALRDIADVRLAYAEPPDRPVYFNGDPAVIVSVSMVDQFDSFRFGEVLKRVVAGVEANLPVGFKLSFITYQPNEIGAAVFGVLGNLWQTIVIVLLVVVFFLGVRTGLIVGMMVPLVMVISVLIMRYVGIELERMSLATLIIALGLLVDNGIVVAEEIQGRIQQGMDRIEAALATGNALKMPLLAASATTILAFMPLMLAPSEAGEYTRSISLVIMIALLVSWVVALTVLILFCVWFIKAGEPVDDETRYGKWYFQRYRQFMTQALRFKWFVVAGAFSTLLLAGTMFQYVSNTFFPNSERTQLQVIVDLPVGANTLATIDVVKRLTAWLSDKNTNPEVQNSVAYIGDGGPRFYLSLNPIDPDPNRAYLIVNVKEPKQVGLLSERVRRFAMSNVPEARVTPKAMSLGPGDAGTIEFRVYGTNGFELKRISEDIQSAMRKHSAAQNVKDDWENPTVKLRVLIDQDAARRAGITSRDIATALDSQLAGLNVTDYRVRDISIPVVLRAQGDQRNNIDLLRTLNVAVAGKAPVPLLQVARFDGDPQFTRVFRRDLERVVTVSAKSRVLTADAFDKFLEKDIEKIQGTMKPGYRIEKGGEIESSVEAQEALGENVPLAFALIALVLIGQFNNFRKPLIIVSTIPLVSFGVAAGLLIMPGANFSFMGILGFLALMGIVINNAIVLIDRIDIELAGGENQETALIEAGVKRLTPIVMTTCTTALGLLPIIISRDVLFYDMAIVIAGGLLVGTLLTLVVVPCLYAIFFPSREAPVEDNGVEVPA